jgi:hypothetical protein
MLVRMTNIMRLSVAAIVGSAAVALYHTSRGGTPYEVTVVARDFAFDAPDSIPAGVTTFRLENQGPGLHQLDVVRLAPGHTPQDFADVMASKEPWPSWMTFLGGANAPEAGGTALATLDLGPGKYLLTCLVVAPDKNTGLPVSSVQHGMMRPLTVTGSRRPSSLPPADVTLTLINYGYTMSHLLVAGKQTIRVRNAAQQPHEALLGQLAPGKTAADLVEWVKHREGPPPVTLLGGASPLSPDAEVEITVNLAPGKYGLWCFVPAEDGGLGVAHGMLREITVMAPASTAARGGA